MHKFSYSLFRLICRNTNEQCFVHVLCSWRTLFIVNYDLHGIVSLLCAGYIKVGESMGRSDLTELHRGDASLQGNTGKKIHQGKSRRKYQQEKSSVKKTVMVICYK